MPVTSIQDVFNASDKNIMFINTEFSGNNAKILNGMDVNVNNCWIPWCTREEDFASHHLQIQNDEGRVLWYIWQNGDHVRASKEGFSPDAPAINGVSAVGSALTIALTNVAICSYKQGVQLSLEPDQQL